MYERTFRADAVSLVAVVAASLSWPGGAAAQTDTTRADVFRLDEIVVVGHRSPSVLRESIAATSVLTRADLEAIGARTLPEALATLPGISFVDRDGSGRLPMAIARGFFGGGETSYVLLTVDGIPVNDTRSGLAEWMQIPVAAVERIELLRGSASMVYGDAALGAVVNVVTRGGGAARARGEVWSGSWGSAGGSAHATWPAGEGWLGALFDFDRSGGYRSGATSRRIASALTFERGTGGGTVGGRLSVSRMDDREPGPLTPRDLVLDRRSSHPAFDGDERSRTVGDLTLSMDRALANRSGTLRGDLRLRALEQDRTRTLLLAPTFGDTQVMEDTDRSAWGRLQYGGTHRELVVRASLEGELASYGVRYRQPGTAGAALSRADGTQLEVGAHAEASTGILPWIDVHVGIRFDAVRPRGDLDDASVALDFSQWSPRAAANLEYRDQPGSEGNLYLSWTGAFKAPTLDQLFDVRAIPTGVPGQTISLSNSDLLPQRSSSWELGLFQLVPLGAEGRHAEASVSVYDQALEDEIDFDVRTFRYGNIQRSRHRGVEAGLRIVLSPDVQIDHTSTLSSVTFRSGSNEGNRLKNIPRTVTHTSVQLRPVPWLALRLAHRGTGGVFLDDANREWLAGSDLVDLGVRVPLRSAEASISVRNVFDAEFESYGFLLFDPQTGVEERMTSPGPGRSLTVRLTVPLRTGEP